MGRYAQLVIGPAGSGKVHAFCLPRMNTQRLGAGFRSCALSRSRHIVTTLGNTARLSAAPFTL